MNNFSALIMVLSKSANVVQLVVLHGNAYSQMCRQQCRESLLLRSSSLLQLLVWTRSNTRHSNVAFDTLHGRSSFLLICIKLEYIIP